MLVTKSKMPMSGSKFSKSMSNTIDISSNLAKTTLDKTFAKLNHITQKSGNRPLNRR